LCSSDEITGKSESSSGGGNGLVFSKKVEGVFFGAGGGTVSFAFLTGVVAEVAELVVAEVAELVVAEVAAVAALVDVFFLGCTSSGKLNIDFHSDHSSVLEAP
jgi:hypothetical protein